MTVANVVVVSSTAPTAVVGTSPSTWYSESEIAAISHNLLHSGVLEDNDCATMIFEMRSSSADECVDVLTQRHVFLVNGWCGYYI